MCQALYRLSFKFSQSPRKQVVLLGPFYRRRNRLREVRLTCQDHRPSKCRKWKLNLGSLTEKPISHVASFSVFLIAILWNIKESNLLQFNLSQSNIFININCIKSDNGTHIFWGLSLCLITLKLDPKLFTLTYFGPSMWGAKREGDHV